MLFGKECYSRWPNSYFSDFLLFFSEGNDKLFLELDVFFKK